LLCRLLRLLIGPSHRLLLPTAALLGAALLVIADTFARTLAAPAELPIGIVTAVIGRRSSSIFCCGTARCSVHEVGS
jgi:ABC-type Fe3+-siderophore transport system permease subunit